MLEQHIRKELEQKEILLMTHLVLGYPSFEDNRQVIAKMVEAGVELIELQIPFSEPMSDGPVILKANDDALKHGTTVAACFDVAQKICAAHPHVAFLFMTYGNIMFAHGIERFIANAKELGIRGTIIPDIPPEEGERYVNACRQQAIAPIFIFTPTNTKARLEVLANVAQGFIYCVGRRGVTGSKTSFDIELQNLIESYKSVTELPIALGFGIQEKADVDFLIGKVDIAVIGTQVLRIQERDGIDAVGDFLNSVRRSS